MKKLFSNKTLLVLGSFILLGFLLRIYNINNLFYYTMDEEVMNLIQRRIILGEHFPLIGSVSPLGTYLGPIFYYFGAAILWFSNLNPVGQGVFGALLGAVNIFLIYKVAKELFNQKVGLFAAVLYSTSFLMVIFDRRWWHLSPGPFLSLLILFSLYKIKNGSIKFIYLLTGALILGWNTDYTNLILFLFVAVAWLVFRLPIKRKEVLIAVTIFLLSNLPLVAFDLRHDFLNVRAFVSYMTHKEVKFPDSEEGSKNIVLTDKVPDDKLSELDKVSLPIITFSRLIYVNSNLNLSEQHTYCKQYIVDRTKAQGLLLPLLSLSILIIFTYFTIKNRKSKDGFSFRIILSFYLVFQLGVLFYGIVYKGDLFEHYLSTLLPYLFIILAVLFEKLYSSRLKVLSIILALSFIVLNINLSFHAYNQVGFKDIMDGTKYAISQVGDKDFELESVNGCYRYYGFYYPFLLSGKHPVKSYQDPNYSWLYNYQVTNDTPSQIVVMAVKPRLFDDKFDQVYSSYQKYVKTRQTFGGLEVLILDNSKGELK